MLENIVLQTPLNQYTPATDNVEIRTTTTRAPRKKLNLGSLIISKNSTKSIEMVTEEEAKKHQQESYASPKNNRRILTPLFGPSIIVDDSYHFFGRINCLQEMNKLLKTRGLQSDLNKVVFFLDLDDTLITNTREQRLIDPLIISILDDWTSKGADIFFITHNKKPLLGTSIENLLNLERAEITDHPLEIDSVPRNYSIKGKIIVAADTVEERANKAVRFSQFNNIDKNFVIKDFLNNQKKTYETVVFIDDNASQVSDVYNYLLNSVNKLLVAQITWGLGFERRDPEMNRLKIYASS